MNRNEFVIATAIVLMLAFTLGWFAHLVVQRLRRVSAADMGELEKLAQALHEAGSPKIRLPTSLQSSGTPSSFIMPGTWPSGEASPIQQLPIPKDLAASIMFSAARAQSICGEKASG